MPLINLNIRAGISAFVLLNFYCYADLLREKIIMSFKFKLKEELKIDASNEAGSVIARAEYNANEDQYLLRYQAADGRAVESWWGESALIAG